MLIDWFTVGAQVLNFAVLVWLMKRFLYQPILDAIDAREKLIASELADAGAKQTEAKKERDEFQMKNSVIDGQRAALLLQATEAAKAERERLIEQARQAADAVRAKRDESLRNDTRNLHQAISRRAEHEIMAIARKVLTDLAATSLEGRMVEIFIDRVQAMDGITKEGGVAAFKSVSSPALVRSAFELTAEQRAAILQAINETFAIDTELVFETAPELICGIELSANGQKVAWSIADYLLSLEQSITEVLKKNDTPVPTAGLKPENKSESIRQDATAEKSQ
ncbi:ATP synthase subunit B [soil metagenome]